MGEGGEKDGKGREASQCWLEAFRRGVVTVKYKSQLSTLVATGRVHAPTDRGKAMLLTVRR